jgi:predicted RNA binding protein YcfA (HicA-like mRNA interferase family)
MHPGLTRDDAKPRFLGTRDHESAGEFGYERDRQRGSHVILKYKNPDTGEVRTVTVPLHDRIKIGTLQSIADQCGANDFDEWCLWIDEHR